MDSQIATPELDLKRPNHKKLEKKGIKDAQLQNPVTDIDHKNGIEAQLEADAIRTYNEEATRNTNAVIDEDHKQEIIKNEITAMAFLGSLVQTTKTLVKSFLVESRGRLLTLFRRENNAIAHTTGFQEKHKLDRDAFVPRSLKLFYAVMALMIIVEAMGQSTFFVETMGWIPSIQLAIVFSAMNVLISALLVAEGVRYAYHRNLALKLIGLTVLVLFLVSFFMGHLVLAHYRMALMEKDVSQAAMKAIEYFQTQPFKLDLNSWTLLIVGYLFAITSLLSGLYKTKDVYPGYTHVTRRRDEAITQREKYQHHFIGDMKQIIDRAIKSVEEYAESLKILLNGYKTAASKKAKLVLVNEFLKKEINNEYLSSVDAYRTPIYQNAVHNLPVYMREKATPLALSGLDDVLNNLAGDDGSLEMLETMLNRHIKEAEDVVMELDRTKNELMDPEGIESFVAKVSKAARDRKVFYDEIVEAFPPKLAETLKV